MVFKPKCDAWIILADHYQARLLGCSDTPTGRHHLTEYNWIENSIPDIEFGRPCALAGMTGHSYAASHHRLEEEYRRFAKQVAQWINTCIERFGIEKLTAFVPDRSHQDVLAHLRHDYRDRVTLRGENLIKLSHDELCRHPIVAGLLHPHAQTQTA